jgi:hypothetical protein
MGTVMSREKLRILCILIVGLPALVILPFPIWGYPRGHDIAFHVDSWRDLIQHWREGTFFPGWAAWANYGFGDARFIFYPPLSRMFAAAVSFVISWRMVPGAFIWAMIAIAGLSMYRLARFAMPAGSALQMGVLFAANPYLLLVVYQRSAFAELMASAVFPLVVLGVLRLSSRGWYGVIPLAWAFGALWLANVPAGIVATYCVVTVGLVWSVIHRDRRILLLTAISMAIGLAVDAFYIVPAVYELRWVNISALLASNLTPEANFLFSTHPDTAFGFNRAISLTVVAELILFSVALFRLNKARLRDPLSRVLVILAAVSLPLMLPLSLPLWKSLPAFQFIQFPWRWMLVFNTAFAFFLGVFFHGRKNAWMFIFLLSVFTGFGTSRAGWGAKDIDLAKESIDLRQGYKAAGDYAPAGSNPGLLSADSADVGLDSSSLRIERWSGEKRVFTLDTPAPVTAPLKLLAYPAWSAEVNGDITRIIPDPTTGQATLLLPAGHNRVQLDFRLTPDRIAGNLVSALTVATLLTLAALLKWRRPYTRA